MEVLGLPWHDIERWVEGLKAEGLRLDFSRENKEEPTIWPWGLPRRHWWQRAQLPMQETWETWAQSLSQQDPLEEGMEIHSSLLAWRAPVHRVAKRGTRLKRLSTHARTADMLWVDMGDAPCYWALLEDDRIPKEQWQDSKRPEAKGWQLSIRGEMNVNAIIKSKVRVTNGVLWSLGTRGRDGSAAGKTGGLTGGVIWLEKKKINIELEGLPWWPRGSDTMLPTQGA